MLINWYFVVVLGLLIILLFKNLKLFEDREINLLLVDIFVYLGWICFFFFLVLLKIFFYVFLLWFKIYIFLLVELIIFDVLGLVFNVLILLIIRVKILL